jgi:hypothetical protein
MNDALEPLPHLHGVLRTQLVGRMVTGLRVNQDKTVLTLDDGAELEMPGFSYSSAGLDQEAA